MLIGSKGADHITEELDYEFFMWAARILLAWSIQPRKLRTCLLLREHAHSLACTQPAVSFYYYLLVGSVLKKIEDLFYQINIASYQIVSVLDQNSFWLQVCSTTTCFLHCFFVSSIVTFNIMLIWYS